MKTFYDIEEQDRAISILQKAYLNNSIAQAYLFEGISGIGKSLIAKVFIKLINCKNPTPALNPCNECSNCINIENGTCIDLIHVKPNSTKEIIKIDKIREIEEKIAYSAYKGNYKVVLIEDAEQMNISSSNALLKTLEEPPSNTIFILTASKISKLPDTILSRCQKILFSPLSKDVIYARLKLEYTSIKDNDLRIIASISQGSITIAKEIIENNILEIRKEFIDTILLDNSTKLANLIKYIKKIIKEFRGEKFYFLAFFLEILKSMMRDALIFNSKLSKNILLNSDYINIIEKISTNDSSVLIAEGEKISNLQNKILTNVNVETAFENYFISFLKRGIV
jgi:DNA polymerase III subunit gamma/tau